MYFNYLCLPPLKGEIYCFRAVHRLSSSVVVVCHKSLCAQLLLHYSSEFKTFLHACLLPYGASHILLAGRSRYFWRSYCPFLLRKCTKIHISLHISATNTDLALKLKICLNHHQISSYTKFHNCNFYFYELCPFLDLEKCT